MQDGNSLYKDFRIEVPAEFQDLFSHFYFAENKSPETVTKTLVPSYQTILVFSFGSPVSFMTVQATKIQIDKFLVFGPIKKSLSYSLSPGAEIFVANFKDDAFFQFFGDASIAEDLPVNPDTIFSENCFMVLWSEMSKINDTQARVNYILEFCVPYLRKRNLIAKEISEFDKTNRSPIKEIAAKNDLSERAVQIKHKKHFGFSAKELNRYQRFLKAVKFIQNSATDSAKIDWFDIISECGYYDQSQLIHDFKHFTNLSPKKYLKFQRDICNSSE